MNHNQQQNRPAPGGKTQRPGNVPSQLEQEAGREREAGGSPRRTLPDQERQRTDVERGTTARPEQSGQDIDREQPANPARQSDADPLQTDVRRDLPGTD